MTEEKEFGEVTVYARDITKPPLLQSDEAGMILIKDRFGDPMILLVRVLSNDLWGLVTRNDPDWDSMLLRYGIRTPNAKKLEDEFYNRIKEATKS